MSPFSVHPVDGHPVDGHPAGGQPPGPRRERPQRRWIVAAVVAGVVALVSAAVVWSQVSPDDAAEPGSSAERPAAPSRSSTTAPPPSTPGANDGVARESCARSFGGVVRDCALLLPQDPRAGERFPVVVLLPGFANGPSDVQGAGAWPAAVASRRLLLVSPKGITDSWNAGTCCGFAQTSGVDDVGYLDALIDDVLGRGDADPERVYVVGFSNGGMMAYRSLCAPGSRITAIASVAGTRASDCAPDHPVSILHVHGRNDPVVPFGGGGGFAGLLLGTTFEAVPESMTSVAAANGCTAAPEVRADGPVQTTEWPECAVGTSVRLVAVDGLQHDWPRGAPVNATDAVLDFFGIG